MARLKPIPRSTAKTAYGLVSDVVRVILEEPKRVNMNFYADLVKPEEGGPACGTVGCFAGWVCLLAGASVAASHESRAVRILGDDLNYLTASGRHNVFNLGYPDINGVAGTPEYAEHVAWRIRHFQQVNATKLRAKRLPPSRKQSGERGITR